MCLVALYLSEVLEDGCLAERGNSVGGGLEVIPLGAAGKVVRRGERGPYEKYSRATRGLRAMYLLLTGC